MCSSGGSPPSQPSAGGSSPPNATAECDRILLVDIYEVVQREDGTDVNRGAQSRNQFINLDPARGRPELGRRIRFRAQFRWASGSTRSLAGQSVYWYAQAGAQNRAGLSGSLRAGFGTAAGSGLLRTPSTTDASGYTGIVEFFLSQYAGDTFSVFATENSDYTGGYCGGTFTVWRRLSYELDCMRRPSGGGTYSDRADTAGLESKCRDVFLELQRTGTDARPAHQRMIKAADARTWATNARDGTGAPRYFHLCMIDTIAWDPAPIRLTFDVPGGSPRIELPASTYLLDSSDWFVSATYRQGTQTGSLQVGNFRLTEEGAPATGDEKFVLTVSYTGLSVNTARNVTIRLEFKNWTEGSGLQTPTGPATLVGVRWRERRYRESASDLSNSTLNTMIHEPGHAMGLASQNLPDGQANTDHYVSTGGPHCHALSNGCVMYEANSSSVRLCDHCVDCVRGRNLSSLPIGATASY